MYRIVLYDTSNFVDFPIGGQLTSIRNFLRYVTKFKSEYSKKILLVGITTEEKHVGVLQKVKIEDQCFDFLPVLHRDTNLSNVNKSLRVEYLKGLFKHRNKIEISKSTVNYIHTPEAYIQVKFCHPSAKIVVFSHGSFFNMLDGFRFYRDNKIVKIFFNKFIISLIKHSDLIFTLDEDSTNQYKKYNSKILQVNNSIVLSEYSNTKKSIHDPLRVLFVGRLSKVKAVDKIINAMPYLKIDSTLTIVGDGEESQHLHEIVKHKGLESKVIFTGAISPNKVGEYMDNSDILVMNSILEGKPMTIIEAMSHGLPIISTNVGGIPEMIKKQFTGEFTNGSAISISEAVDVIVNKYELYSKNAFEESQKYDFKEVNKIVLQSILDL